MPGIWERFACVEVALAGGECTCLAIALRVVDMGHRQSRSWSAARSGYRVLSGSYWLSSLASGSFCRKPSTIFSGQSLLMIFRSDDSP